MSEEATFETATTVVKTLEDIETTLIILFEQQQHLSTGLLSRTDQRTLFASQLRLMLQMKSAVQLARLAVWSLVVPEAEEVVKEPTVYHCEPVEEEEEQS
jgi:hypothetical protein